MAMLRKIDNKLDKGNGGRTSHLVTMMLETSAIDGKIQVGDVVAALSAGGGIFIAGCGLGASLGIGLDAFNVVPGFSPIGAGAFIGAGAGSAAAGVRLLLDLFNRPKTTTLPQPEITTTDNNYRIPKGLEASVTKKTQTGLTMLRQIILPDLPNDIVIERFRLVARAAIRRKEPFSQRGAGRFFGDDYTKVKDQMLKLEMLRPRGKGPRAGYDLTEAGEKALSELL